MPRPFQLRRAFALAVACALALPALAPALRVTPPPLEVTSHRLDNGLEVLLHQDRSVPVVTVQMWYHVGSKDERAGRSGFAHLFEHIMFKGSENVGEEEHGEMVQAVGGRYNATTDFDRTLYFQTVPSQYLERMIWLEAERLRSLRVTEEAFRSEREVVKEERRLRYENAPFGRLFETIFDALFTSHPYRITPIGTMDDLNAAELADVIDFHDTYYVPNNATLVIAGDLDPEETLAWVEHHFGDVPKGEPIARELPPEPPQTAAREVTAYDSNAPLPAVILAYHLPEAGHPDLYPLQVVGNVLSFGQSSRLYRKLVYDSQMALQAGGQVQVMEDSGVFFFYAILNAGHEPADGRASLLEEVARLREEPLAAEELEKAKNQLVSQLVFGRQTVQSKATAIGYAAVILDDVEKVNQDLARYQAVTAEDVQRVARKYLVDTRRTSIFMLPESMRPPAPGGGTGTDTETDTENPAAVDAEATEETRR